MKDRRLKRILTSAAAVLLAFCMSAGSFTTRVFAEEEEKTVFETQDGGENGKQSGEGMSNGLEEPASEELSSEGPGTENPGTDEPGGEEPGTEKPDTEKSGAEEPGDSGKKTETDDTSDNSTGGDENETEEIPVEEPFEETGIFGCYTVNSYGRVINSWYDSSRNAYYLFLTNTGTPESFILYCTGVKPAAVSAGELDEATHVITGAFSATGSEVEVTGSNGQKYTVIAMQSELPSLYISLNGTTLSHINSNGKDEKYNGNSLILTDESGSINLEQDGTVQIKGRGNTTWDSAAKKGYQLKFDKKQKVLGMAKAKKWVLLANSFDDSMARNMTAFHAASSLDMEYVTEYRYVDLWVDGDYQGTYILGEKSEINENRLNLTDPTGVLMELDNFFYGQEDYWFLDAYLNYKFAVKECVDEDNPNSVLSGMDQFRDKLDRFWNYITNTDTSVITLESLGAYIDVESFARWYLVNEFASNVEAASTSCFFYMDGAGDVIHMGPVWDFDSCMGNKKEYSDITLMFIRTNNKIFNRLLRIPAFAEYTKNILVQYDSAFESLALYAEDTGTLIKESAAMNYTRWDRLEQKNEKRDLIDFAGTYEVAVERLKNWLVNRYGFFTGKTDVTASLEGKNIVVRVNDYLRFSSVNVAAWTKDNGQKDLKWKSSGRNGGIFTVTFPLTQFLSAGKVLIHVYGDGTFQKEASVTIPAPEVEYRISEDGTSLTVTSSGPSIYDSLKTAVWSEVNGQDDLKWYTLSGNGDSTLQATVNLLDHGESGLYNFHTYGFIGSRSVFLNAGRETIKMNIPSPDITAEIENGKIVVRIDDYQRYRTLRTASWTTDNGQKDLKWADAVRDKNGLFTVNIPLTQFMSTGEVSIHAYSNLGFSCAAKVVIPSPEVTYTVSEDGTKLTAAADTAGIFSRIRTAVWSEQNGQDDLKWYTLTADADGHLKAEINLLQHGLSGIFNFHTYGTAGNKEVFVNAKQQEIQMEVVIPQLTILPSEDGKTITCSLTGAPAYTRVRFPSWTTKNGQDDLKWYEAANDGSGNWTYVIQTASHGGAGEYIIHCYGIQNGVTSFIGGEIVTVNAPAAAEPEVKAEKSGSLVKAEALNASSYTNVRFAVWTAEDGQDDIRWYKGSLSGGIWAYSFNPAAHTPGSSLLIHVYGYLNGKDTFIGAAGLVK